MKQCFRRDDDMLLTHARDHRETELHLHGASEGQNRPFFGGKVPVIVISPLFILRFASCAKDHQDCSPNGEIV
jgi:hypothetical protein